MLTATIDPSREPDEEEVIPFDAFWGEHEPERTRSISQP